MNPRCSASPLCLMILCVSLIALSPLITSAGAQEWKLSHYNAHALTPDLPRHPFAPITEAEISSWIRDLELDPDEARMLRDLYRAMIDQIEENWVTAKERQIDGVPRDEHFALARNYYELVARLKRDFLGDIPLLFSPEAAARWEASERARWRRELVTMASYDHRPSVYLPDILGSDRESLDPRIAREIDEVLKVYLATLDAILDATEPLALTLARRGTELAEAEHVHTRTEEQIERLRADTMAAIGPLVRSYDRIRNHTNETAELLGPLLPKTQRDALDSALRPRSQYEHSFYGRNTSEYRMMLTVLGADAELGGLEVTDFDSQIARAGDEHIVPMVPVIVGSPPPLSNDQRHRIAQLTAWYNDRFNQIAADADRLGFDSIRHNYRNHHRIIRAPGGEAYLYWLERLAPNEMQRMSEHVEEIYSKRRSLEVDAMKQLRALLTIEQRILILKALDAMRL